MSNLSAVLIVRDESSRIEACLRALEFADEIVVLDTGSTDDTRERVDRLAGVLGCPVRLFIQEGPWEGFGAAREQAGRLASGTWILQVDADEVITTPLREEIQGVVNENRAMQAFQVPRTLHFFLGELRRGGAYPDYSTRLYRPEDGSYFSADHLVHESLILAEGVSLQHLENPMVHNSYHSVSHFFEKEIDYARLWSAQRRRRGNRRFHLWDPVTHAVMGFLGRYFLRLGFLDGIAGLLWAGTKSAFTFLRYAMAYVDQRTGADTTPLQRTSRDSSS